MLKDQNQKKTRTLLFPELLMFGTSVANFTFKTERSRMHGRADFWSNFSEVPGVLKQTSEKLPQNALRLMIFA